MPVIHKLGRGGRIVVALVLGGAIFGIATAVQADIPDAGVIHGCYGRPGTPQRGDLRVIDGSAGEGCRSYENPLSWSQTGPSGARGPTGPTGPTGPSDAFAHRDGNFSATLLQLNTFTTVVSLSLPAGKYVLNASLGFAGANNQSDDGVECFVFNGPNITAPSFEETVRPSGTITLPVTSDVTLTAQTTVSIQCIASKDDEVITQPSTVAAIRVGSLTES